MPETQAAGRPEPSGAREGILDRIVETKQIEVQSLALRSEEVWQMARGSAPPRSFEAALRGPHVSLIAEVKRRSPGAGEIRPGLRPGALAAEYERGGAAAVSVLTDGPWFGGSLDDLREVREETDLPILRKDFTLVPDQIAEARAGGADAVLLIVRILTPDAIRELLDAARDLGLAALVEVHDAVELRTALDSGARIVGINNRDLATFRSDLSTTLDLLEEVSEERVVVSESGIKNGDDVDRLGKAGANAVLVGESLLKAEEPETAARELTGRTRRPRASRAMG